ncbi:MAG: hypothetical protein ACYDCO_04305 [Armatimonadota bacterium]
MRFVLLLSLVFPLMLPLWAYDNDSRDSSGRGLLKNGPHRTINGLAFQQWFTGSADASVKRYTLLDDYMMLGPTVVAPGMEIVTTEDRRGNLRWWVSEGGYDADEPELYNSFRHFYDPRSLDGVPYLTDHLETLNYVYRAVIFTSKPGRVIGAVVGTSINPEVNARDWAISGKKCNGWNDNDYCWEKGRDYLKAAFAETDATKKQRLFAQAWRSLGETMHLMGDMTCIPHVRNCSHPGKAIGYKWIGNTDPNLGYLRNDPYELYCTEDVIRKYAGSSLDPTAKRAVDSASNIMALFDNVARYTQDNFFSANTLAGSYIKDKGKPTQKVVQLKSANGKKTYPLPLLQSCDYNQKTGLFSRVINGKRVRLAVESWSSSVGWGDPAIQGPEVTRECVMDQADILIPVALYANARLADWFIPRMDLQITDINPGTQALAATLTHRTYGAHSDQLTYNTSPGQEYRLWVNGTLQPRNAFVLNVVNNTVSGALRVTGLKKGDKVVLGIGIGGLLVKSPEYVMGEKVQDTGQGCWVFDGAVATPMHQADKDDRGLRTSSSDADINESGGTSNSRCTFTGINKYEYSFEYTHSWNTPPRKLIPGETITLKVIVAEAGFKGTGDAQFYRNRRGDTSVGCALVTSRAIQERMKQQKNFESTHIGLGNIQASAWTDLQRPKEAVKRDEKSITVTIPAHERSDLELAIGYNIGTGVTANIVFYYKWDGPPPPPVIENGGCVTAGTLVTRADGRRASIEQLRPGDRIAAFDQVSGQPATAIVERVLVHDNGPFSTQLLALQSGQTLRVTGNHPIYTAQGTWVPVEELQPGTGVFVFDPATGTLQPTTVLSIIRDQGMLDVVYNLKTSLGDYYANDLLVHNKCLAAGSWIDTPAGPCPVEAIRVGQLVYGARAGRRVITPVTHVYAKRTVLPELPGKRLTPRVAVTVNHRVWDGAAFRPAGDWLAKNEPITGTVYDLQTAAGNYYADGMLMTASE